MLYRLICERDVTLLEEQVEDYLENGWELYGYPFADETNLYQAVIFTGKGK